MAADGGTAPPAGRPRRRSDAVRAQWPLLLCLAVVAVGLVLSAQGFVRRGPALIGGGALLAAGLRLTLPDSLAGLLVVRRRSVDVAALTVLGLSVAVLALTISPRT